MMHCFLSLGSNIHPEKNIFDALNLLKGKCTLKKISSIYETEPVGPAGHHKFWNLAVLVEYGRETTQLVLDLCEIERRLGRERDPQNKCAPRTIDLDILPQAGYQKHPFVIIPLAEIAPNERDPASGKTYRELAEDFPSREQTIRKMTFPGLLD